MSTTNLNDIASKSLGSSASYAVYTDRFDPSLLNPMPRKLAREGWSIKGDEFVGYDTWHCHESTFVGYFAGASCVSGTDNTFIGGSAGTNTTGSKNTAIGSQALQLNTTASNNTAVGYQAGYTNTTGTGHSVLGYQALQLNTTGGYNTAFGYQAGQANTTGGNLVAIGSVALYKNTTGAENIGIGAAALATNTTGQYNVAVGSSALTANATASNNTAVGYQAGYTSTGFGQTFIGYRAGYTSNPSSTTIGYNTGVGHQSLFLLTTGVENVAVGDASGYNLTTGTYNSFFGPGAGFSVTSGSKNTILGNYSGNQGGLDIRTASNYIVLSDGDGNWRCYFDNNGSFKVPQVYVDTTAAAANVNVGATGFLTRSTSALKYKQDVRDLEEMDINLLRAVRYKSKCAGDDQTKDHFGIVADEVDAAGIKELVSYGADGEVEGFQYERLTVVLLNPN